jgi:hypothetical protein
MATETVVIASIKEIIGTVVRFIEMAFAFGIFYNLWKFIFYQDESNPIEAIK